MQQVSSLSIFLRREACDITTTIVKEFGNQGCQLCVAGASTLCGDDSNRDYFTLEFGNAGATKYPWHSTDASSDINESEVCRWGNMHSIDRVSSITGQSSVTNSESTLKIFFNLVPNLHTSYYKYNYRRCDNMRTRQFSFRSFYYKSI